ncbi:MAG: ATP synthase F1 subunit delta [Patescibacteria group bacterium]|nr:ATP synthase F1 subunit delta [Patescibacteria group bacterium]
MKITAKQYAVSLFEAIDRAEGSKIRDIIKNFSRILVENNQTSQLGKIIGQFERIWDKKNKIVKAEIISALKLTPETEKAVKFYLKRTAEGGEVKLSQKVDKSVLGGLIIKRDDRILDASLKTRLAEFKNVIGK